VKKGTPPAGQGAQTAERSQADGEKRLWRRRGGGFLRGRGGKGGAPHKEKGTVDPLTSPSVKGAEMLTSGHRMVRITVRGKKKTFSPLSKGEFCQGSPAAPRSVPEQKKTTVKKRTSKKKGKNAVAHRGGRQRGGCGRRPCKDRNSAQGKRKTLPVVGMEGGVHKQGTGASGDGESYSAKKGALRSKEEKRFFRPAEGKRGKSADQSAKAAT